MLSIVYSGLCPVPQPQARFLEGFGFAEFLLVVTTVADCEGSSHQ